MTRDDVFNLAAAIITSLGGSAFLLVVFSSWLGKVWADRLMQNERSKHEQLLNELQIKNDLVLEHVRAEVDYLKHKELGRHFDKLSIYREVVLVVAEILRELEGNFFSKKTSIAKDVENNFALNRYKLYGFISLASSQDVMDRYNDMIDFFLPLVYEDKSSSWEEMREKADAMLNAMRRDLGINEGDIFYRGIR